MTFIDSIEEMTFDLIEIVCFFKFYIGANCTALPFTRTVKSELPSNSN